MVMRTVGEGGLSEWRDDHGRLHPHYAGVASALEQLGPGVLAERWQASRRQAERDGFTFYLDPREYRTTPIDVLPRVIPAEHWARISAGVAQRLRAINRWVGALYGDGQDVVPNDVVYSCDYFLPEAEGFRPPRDVWVHIYGIDLVHMGDGRYYILEDNLRVPSGITYQMKTLEIAAQQLPEFAEGYDITPYDVRETYLDLFRSVAPDAGPEGPAAVILTDGKFGSAFFEHRYLSDLLGAPLVEGSDLYVGHDGRVHARTADGDYAVDVVYRRIQDLEIFVPGLRDAYFAGKVALINGVGAEVADDKLVFLWVPEMIRRHLGEEPILEQAPSHNLLDAEERRYAHENLEQLVIKSRRGYGGIGVYVMPDLGDETHAQVRALILSKPDEFIAQETLDFSSHVVYDEQAEQLEPRYVDLRVFAVQDGEGRVSVFPGGLTRVARAGSRVTNNSSGGLCKPTWVLT